MKKAFFPICALILLILTLSVSSIAYAQADTSDCISCHGVAVDFSVPSVNKTYVCWKCHYQSSHSPIPLVSTPYGYFTYSYSPGFPSTTIHAAHERKWSSSLTCVRCHETADCSVCHETVSHTSHASTVYSPVLLLVCNGWDSYVAGITCANSLCHGQLPTIVSQPSCTNCHDAVPHELTGVHASYSCSECHDTLKEEAICYQCHNDPANSNHGINIQQKFTMGTATWTGQSLSGYYKKVNTRHDISDSDQLWSRTKIECNNCHNAHLNTRENPYIDPDSRNTLWTQTRSDPKQGTVLDVIGFCLKCHDDTWAADSTVTGPAEIRNIKTAYVSDQHGDAVGNRKTNYRNGYSRGYPRMLCTDCHDPHGGGGLYHLKTLTDQYGKPVTITDPNAHEVTHWCSHCHNNPMGKIDSKKDGCLSRNCHLHGTSSF